MEGWRATLKRAIGDLRFPSFRSKKETSSSLYGKQTALFREKLPPAGPIPPELPKSTSPEKATISTPAPARATNQIDRPVAPSPVGRPTSPGAFTANGNNARMDAAKPEIPVKTAAKRIEPAFPAPDMSRLTVRYKDAKGATSQPWQAAGRQLSLYSSKKKGTGVCTIGLDFGTAFTKACFQFRAAQYVADWRLAVPECTPPLLPSVSRSSQTDHAYLATREGLQSPVSSWLFASARRCKSDKRGRFSRSGSKIYTSPMFHRASNSVFRFRNRVVSQHRAAHRTLARSGDIRPLRTIDSSSMEPEHVSLHDFPCVCPKRPRKY